MVTGWTGAGKTTTAELVAEQLGATVASFDWLVSGLRVDPAGTLRGPAASLEELAGEGGVCRSDVSMLQRAAGRLYDAADALDEGENVTRSAKDATLLIQQAFTQLPRRGGTYGVRGVELTTEVLAGVTETIASDAVAHADANSGDPELVAVDYGEVDEGQSQRAGSNWFRAVNAFKRAAAAAYEAYPS